MAKAKTAYVRSECGADHNKWQGQCGECGAWNTLSEIVVEPGWIQVAATVLMIVGCCGVAFSMFGRFVEHAAGNATLRIATAALACIALFHPDDSVGWAAAALVLPLTLFGVWRHRRLVSAKDTFESQPAT